MIPDARFAAPSLSGLLRHRFPDGYVVIATEDPVAMAVRFSVFHKSSPKPIAEHCIGVLPLARQQVVERLEGFFGRIAAPLWQDADPMFKTWDANGAPCEWGD